MSFRINLFLFLAAAFFIAGAQATSVTFKNNCPFTVWPGTLTGGPPGVPQLSTTGFELSSMQTSKAYDLPPNWTSGRFWGRTGCSTDAAGKFTCTTADCGSDQVECNGKGGVPPATLAEITLTGADDTYDVSLVDGFNLQILMAPAAPQGDKCKSTSCRADINAVCPPQFQTKGPDGRVVGCKSACAAFNQPQYCCTGDYSKSETCPPTEYSKFFKDQCPEAYSYAYDDPTSTFTCPTGQNYLITFCP
ncbi:Thaumatin-like protein 1a [Linum grandiflorum]